MANWHDIASALGTLADFLGLAKLIKIEKIQEAAGTLAGHAIKATVGKQGTFKEFNEALCELTQAEQDAIDEVLSAITDKKEADNFRINAVLTGPAKEDTVKLLRKVAVYPSPAEAVAYLQREHYLEPSTPTGPGVTQKIGDAAKAVGSAAKDLKDKVNADVTATGVEITLDGWINTMKTKTGL